MIQFVLVDEFVRDELIEKSHVVVDSSDLIDLLSAGRFLALDPFRSLAISGPELRPFLEDLRVASIIFDARYPARSVAVLLDMDDGTRYSVRVDDEFGRLKVFEIRAYEIVLTIEDFGVPRQVVLTIRRRQEGNS